MNAASPPVCVLIVGLGSIGSRHRDVLGALGCQVFTVSRRPGGDFATIEGALASGNFELAVLATETARHGCDLRTLVAQEFRGAVMVEKPVCRRPGELDDAALPWPAWTAYNLRFSPLVTALRERLAALDEPVLCAEFVVGQDLRDWRPGRRVEDTYSASDALGGGVLLDLSHELDLARWLLGPCERLCALGGRLGDVTADSDDCWNILARHRDCAQVSIHLNYFDRPGRRWIHLNTSRSTLDADLIGGTLRHNNELLNIDEPIASSYRAMWQSVIESLRGDGPPAACSLAEGLAVVDTVAACRVSAVEHVWVEL